MTHDQNTTEQAKSGGVDGVSVSQKVGGTHDSLCPFVTFVRYAGPCQCDLIVKVRADTIDSVINLLEEMHSERVWWNDMLTWCISVNEAISQIDNIRWEKEEV